MALPPHLYSPLTRRRALALLGTAAGLCATGRADAAWKLVKIGNREYVTAQGIKEFYKFSSLERRGPEVTLRSTTAKIQLRLRAGSQEMRVNGVKFMLSLPATTDGTNVLVSRIDLSKLIDPVLRPKHIATGPLFTTVVVDPGHGGHDSGAVGTFANEKFYTLDTSLRLSRHLQARGFRVVLTRTKDTYPSLSDRVKVANATPNCVFVSIHFNHGGSTAQGIETYALAPQGTNRSRKEDSASDDTNFRGNSRDSENIALATAIHASMLHQLQPVVDRGILRDRWFLLKGIERPAVLVEGGFVSSPSECAKLHTPVYRDRLAVAIAIGIVNFRRALIRG